VRWDIIRVDSRFVANRRCTQMSQISQVGTETLERRIDYQRRVGEWRRYNVQRWTHTRGSKSHLVPQRWAMSRVSAGEIDVVLVVLILFYFIRRWNRSTETWSTADSHWPTAVSQVTSVKWLLTSESWASDSSEHSERVSDPCL